MVVLNITGKDMGRPVRLTDEERKRSNAARQRRWYYKHEGFAKLKGKNYREKMKAVRLPDKPNEKVFKPNAQGKDLPHFGDGMRYEAEPGVDVGYGEMEPNLRGGRQQSPARATSGGPTVRGDGPELEAGVCPRGFERPSGSTLLGPAPLEDAPRASLTPNERLTYSRLEEFKARRRAREGVRVELIL